MWTLVNIQTGFTVTISNPELGDTYRTERRQASGETEGGRLFTQDLQREDTFLEGSFSGISRCEKEDLEAFARSVLFRAKQFILTTTGGGAQVPVGSSGNWSGRVRFDQSRLEFRVVTPDPQSGAREFFETTIAFRVFPQIDVTAADVVDVVDAVSLAGSTLALGLPLESVSAADSASAVVT